MTTNTNVEIVKDGVGNNIILNKNWNGPDIQVDDRRFTRPGAFKVEIYMPNAGDAAARRAGAIDKVNVTDLVASINWSDGLEQAAVEGTIELHDPVHPYTGNRRLLNIKKGQRIKISIINDQGDLEELGRYVIWEKVRKSREDASLTISFKDILVYLQKSEDTWLFQKDPKKKPYKKGWTAKQITMYVARRYQIPLARKTVWKTKYVKVNGRRVKKRVKVSVIDLPNCTYKNPLIRVNGGSVYELLLKVWTEERRMTGRKYLIRAEKDKLRVIAKKEQPVLTAIQEGQNLISSTFTDSLEGMATAVTVMTEPKSNTTNATTQSTDRTTTPTATTRQDPYPAQAGGDGWKTGVASFFTVEDEGGLACEGYRKDSSLMGFGEAAKNQSSAGPYDAMGVLPCGTMIEVRYNNKTLQLPKVDKGAGGPGIGDVPRVMDLTSAAWDAFGIDRSLGKVKVEWRKATGAGAGATVTGGVTATAKNQRKIDQYGYIHKLVKLDKAITKKDARKQALDILRTNLKENLDGSVTCHLIPRLRAGEPIFVRDEASRLIGKFYCGNVSHTLSPTGCTTTIDLNWLDMVPSALLTDEDKGIQSSSGGGAGTNCGETAVQAGRQYIGTPYSWGGGGSSGPSYGIARTNGQSGTNINGFDCSGFVQYCWAQAGVSVPRHTDALATVGVAVPKGQEQIGDILLYDTSDGAGSRYGHTALYSGPGMIINSGGGAGGGVREYARSDHVLVRRVSQLCPQSGGGGGGGGGGSTPPPSTTQTQTQTVTIQYNPLMIGNIVGPVSGPGAVPNVYSNFMATNKLVTLTYNGKSINATSRKPTFAMPSGVTFVVEMTVAYALGISTKPMQKFTGTVTYV